MSSDHEHTRPSTPLSWSIASEDNNQLELESDSPREDASDSQQRVHAKRSFLGYVSINYLVLYPRRRKHVRDSGGTVTSSTTDLLFDLDERLVLMKKKNAADIDDVDVKSTGVRTHNNPDRTTL